MRLKNWHIPGTSGAGNAQEFDITGFEIVPHIGYSMSGGFDEGTAIKLFREDGRCLVLLLSFSSFRKLAASVLRRWRAVSP